MNRPHFRRRPRPTDPEPEYSRLDRLDGLHTRIDRLDRLDRLRTRYDAEWPDVLAAEAPAPLAFVEWLDMQADDALLALPADQSGFTGWGYGEGYDIESEATLLAINADALDRIRAARVAPPDLPMVRAAATAYDLGLPVPLRSDPPIYKACLAGHTGVTR